MRKFTVEVKPAQGPYYGMYVTLLEDLMDIGVAHLRKEPEHTWRVWYHDRLLRKEDVRPTVKNHIDFVRSFGDDVQVDIRDLRNEENTVTGPAPQYSSGM